MTDAAFWAEQWRAGKIRFHEGKPNPYLVRFAPRLDDHGRVFVPMCGKTEDLAYLAGRGHQVVGVELVEDAVAAFFAEHELVPRIVKHEGLVEYIAEGVTIYAGDLFALGPKQLGPIDAIYDRAALVAMPEDVRQPYVDHLITLSRPWVHALTVTLEYDQALMAGPPFSVDTAALMRLYDGYGLIHLAEAPETSRAIPMIERCFLITG